MTKWLEHYSLDQEVWFQPMLQLLRTRSVLRQEILLPPVKLFGKTNKMPSSNL